jgi:hypothetical protein
MEKKRPFHDALQMSTSKSSSKHVHGGKTRVGSNDKIKRRILARFIQVMKRKGIATIRWNAVLIPDSIFYT